MRKLLRSAAAAAALVAVATLVAAAPAATATTNVAITHSGFVLKAITIQQGDSVMWTNSDTSSHQVVSQSAGFASPVLKPGDTFTYVFTKAGKFGYTDAFNKTFDGTVTVAPAGSVTLDNSTGLVTYGGRVVLSGTVSSNQAGEPVNVLQTQCGKTAQSAERIASATTTTGGAYSASVQPTMRTTYVAMWKSSTSPSVAVSVRPRVHLGRVSLRRFSVRVYAGSSLAGHTFTVQRWSRPLQQWVRVRYARLFSNSSGVDPTVVSSVTFTLQVSHPVRLRVAMSQFQVGGCYSPSRSNSIIT